MSSEYVRNLSDRELRDALKAFNESPGPITDSTRNLYRKKLESLVRTTPNKGQDNMIINEDEDDDDDTSDEDFVVEDEDDEDDEEEEYDENAYDVVEEDLTHLNDDDDDLNNPKLSSSRSFLRGALISLVTFFAALFVLYMISTNTKLLEPLKPLKSVTKQVLILLALSPIGYFCFRTLRFYKLRRHEENQRVCEMVSQALELLQSPDNPKGLMPILHIRDTLLTPAERKLKKMDQLWNKAVKFVENHESRVKVELVNIDGEDFRAWKWIGSRKL